MFDKLDAQIFQIHLNGPGMSGRGVRFRMLKPKQKRASDAVAATKVDKDASIQEFVAMRLLEGVRSFITEITLKANLPTLFPESGEVEWKKVSYVDLAHGGDCDIDSGELFTALDVEFLEGLYRMYHEPSQEQVKTILGEQKTLA